MIPDKYQRPWKPDSQKTYRFTNATIIDPVEGSLRQHCTVITADGYIKSIKDSKLPEKEAEPSSYKNAINIDLTGKYLCPGLIDCHVHLASVPGIADVSKMFTTMSSPVSYFRQPWVCRQMLHRGFTTVRDCGGATLALKEAIEEGVFPGPRIFLAGKALSQTGGHADMRGRHDYEQCPGGCQTGVGHLCDGVPEVMKAARSELRQGSDFIKIMASGGVSSPTDALTNVQFTPEEIQAIVKVAENNDTYVTAHAYTPRSIKLAIENGVRGIEHGNLLDEDTARLMVEKGCFLTPTLVTYAAMAEEPGFLEPESAAKNEAVLKTGLEALKIAKEAGVTMCFGTDLLGALGRHQSREFSIRGQVLEPVEVLRSATVNAARLIKQEERLGRVEEGFLADMLILNGNPLEDAGVLTIPEKSTLAVIKEGRVVVSRWSELKEMEGLQDVDITE